MPRSTRSDVDALLQEAHAVELLANEAEISPDRIQEYWILSADLIALVTDIEELRQEQPSAGYDDPTLFTLKHRLRQIISRLSELSVT